MVTLVAIEDVFLSPNLPFPFPEHFLSREWQAAQGGRRKQVTRFSYDVSDQGDQRRVQKTLIPAANSFLLCLKKLVFVCQIDECLLWLVD
jgi:hypothetical protein